MTPTDLAKWDIAFIDKRILSARSYEEFTREVKLADGSPTHYALGLNVADRNGTPLLAHGGEVSGFLATNEVFPVKRAAVIVCSNQDGINLIFPIARQIVQNILPAPGAEALETEAKQVRAILEGLQQGQIDRSLFTSNANAYFTQTALGDFRSSLTPLGKLEDATKESEQSRGGMTHLSYRARFEKKTVGLNIYKTPGGKFEQYMVVETF